MSTICAPEEGGRRLHELRVDERSDLVLAVLAMGSALAATSLHPPFALPLFIGGAVALLLSGRAFFRRLDLVDELLLDTKAYAIPEIRRRAEETAGMKARRELASTARTRLTPAAGYQLNPRAAAVEAELRILAEELEDEGLRLEPFEAVCCKALLTDYARSPLLNDELPAEDAMSWVRRIRLGFDPTDVA